MTTQKLMTVRLKIHPKLVEHINSECGWLGNDTEEVMRFLLTDAVNRRLEQRQATIRAFYEAKAKHYHGDLKL